MKTRPSRILFVALVPVVLGGCSSLFGERFASIRQVERPNSQIRRDQGKPVTTTSATEEGRTMLSEGQPGKAIEAFQRALSSGEQIAPALNGMGVAYARIGRTDLAVRYFEQSLAADPQNIQFAQNLDRMTRAMTVTNAERAELANRPTPNRTAVAAKTPAGAKAVESTQRPSRPEIRIATLADSPSAAPRLARIDPRFRPLVRIEFARSPSSEIVQRRIDVAANFKPIARFGLESLHRSNLPEVQVASVVVRPVK